ncbi:hypothetical protein HY285_01545 [Candidatus Peregrinibacteria bacterium]|nr:hypothetical protein [Candidatus Peregrinibacteria bacterium]MBI3816213.1 hypothetical protein [Candidatus Peregrinibacteria bacterium]
MRNFSRPAGPDFRPGNFFLNRRGLTVPGLGVGWQMERLRVREDTERWRVRTWSTLRRGGLFSTPEAINNAAFLPMRQEIQNRLFAEQKEWSEGAAGRVRLQREHGSEHAERLEGVLSSAQVPESLQHQALSIIKGIEERASYAEPEEGKATFNPIHFAWALRTGRERIEGWLQSGVVQGSQRAALGEVLAYVQGYERVLGTSPAYPRSVIAIGPDQKKAGENLGKFARLITFIATGSLGLFTGAVSALSGQNDFTVPAMYLGAAGLAAGGGRALLEPRDKRTIRLASGLTKIGGPGERILLAYGVRGEAWAKLIEELQDNSSTELRDAVRTLRQRGKTLTAEQRRELFASLEIHDPTVAKQFSRMIENKGDFLAFTRLAQSASTEDARELMRDYVRLGAGPQSMGQFSAVGRGGVA